MIKKNKYLMAALAAMTALGSQGATGTWNVDAAGNWSLAGNWLGDIPTAAGDTANLTNNITAARTVTLDTTPRTVGTLSIGDSGSPFVVFTLAASGGANLIFDNGGAGAQLLKPNVSTAIDIISAPITLNDNLIADVAKPVTITGVITESGPRSITKNGTGILYLSSVNNYSGGTVLNAGELQVQNNTIGSGLLTINGGIIVPRGGGRTLTNEVVVNADFTMGDGAVNSTMTLAGNMNIGSATRTITVPNNTSDPDAVLLGTISGTGGLTKATSGSVLMLGGVNTFSGDTRILGGNLMLTTNAAAPANTGLSLQNSTVDLNAADAGLVRYRGSSITTKAVFGGLKGSRNHEMATTTPAPVALSVGNNGQNTLYSGVLFGPSGASLTKIGTGTLTLTGANTYDGGTTISDGSLQLGDGGTSGAVAPVGALVNNGNLTINRNNTTVQGVDFSSLPITGTGSFTQAGPGTTILNVANSYSGPTIVSAGKLIVTSDQQGGGAINVANGATLAVTAVGGSQLQPASLTLGAGAGCTIELNGVSLAGALLNPATVTRNGAVTVNVTGISGALVVGGTGYPLLANAGASTSGYTLGTQPPGTTGHLAVSGNTLTYVVDTLSDIWNAAAPGGAWDVALTPNWTGNAANNTPPNTFANGDVVLLNDNVSGPQTVTVAAPIAAGKVNVDNATTDYTIVSTPANNLGGAGSVAKSGTGALTLSGPNTYSGGTVLSAGTMNINDGAAIGTGPLTITGGTLDNTSGTEVLLSSNNAQNWNGDFAFTGSFGLNLGTGAVTPVGNRQLTINGSLTVGGPIGGTSSLTKAGFGPLTLSGASTYSGGTVLSSGQLNINNGGSGTGNSAIGVGPLTIGANTLIDNTSGSDVTLKPSIAQTWAGNFTYLGSANSLNLGNGPVTLTGTRTVTVTGSTLSVGGPISGAFELVKAGAGTLVLSGVNTFTGQMNLSEGTLAVANDLALGTGRLNLKTATLITSADATPHTITNALNFDGTDANMTFGGPANLTFTGNNAGNSSGKIFTVNNQTEFQGNISGTTRTIAGSGKMIVSGTTTYSGTSINLGATLQVGNGGSTGTISGGSATVANEGTLIINRNNGVLQSAELAAGGISGFGTIIQAGSGTTTLNALNNTFQGPVIVNNGQLFISSAYQGGSTVTVANGAGFGVASSADGTTATIGGLTLGTGGATTLNFSYNVAGNPSVAALQAGAVTVSGTSTIRIGGNFTVGTFPVLKYTSLSGAFAATVAAPRGVTATLVNDAATQTIKVTVSSVTTVPIVWSGADSVLPNVWDLNTTKNWLVGSTPTEYVEFAPPGDAVLFNDSGSGTVLVSNTVSPLKVTINNPTVAYALEGTGQINASLGLTKTGAGAVTLNLPGNYLGTTVLSNGTINVGANQSFENLSGDAPLVNGGAGRVVTATGSSDTTYAGGLNGALGLTKLGTGTLTLTGNSTMTGNLFSRAGTTVIDTGGAIDTGGTYSSIALSGSDVATLTIKGSGSFTNSNDFNVGDVGSSVGVLNIQDNGSLRAARIYIASANAAGSTAQGTVNQTGGTVTQTDTAANSFAIGGRVTGASGVAVYNISGGSIWSGGGFRVGGFGTGTLNVSGTAYLYSGGGINIARETGSVGTVNFNGGVVQTRDVTSSTLAGVANFNGSTLIPTSSRDTFMQNLAVANVRNGGIIIDTTNFNVSATQNLAHSAIDGDNAIDGGLTKLGSGTLYLNGVNSYTGNTTVNEGVLAGVGTLGSPVVVNANGRIGAGNPGATTGALLINNTLSIQGGASLRLNKTGGALVSDTVVVSGAATYGGVLSLTNITSDGTPLAIGDTFTVFTAASHAGSFSSIVGPAGYGSTFKDGVLTITSIGPSSPGTITSSFAGNVLSLSWPAGENWRLQTATNLVNPNWEYVTDGSVNSTNITVDQAKAAAFFRLVYP